MDVDECQAAPAAILQKAALDQAKGVLQTAVAIAATDVPPAAYGQNAPCVPMVTGHNCFGAVLYPITFGDSVMADVSDSKVCGQCFQLVLQGPNLRGGGLEHLSRRVTFLSLNPGCRTVLVIDRFPELNGAIANFPALFRSRVGVADDSTYYNCFSAYMR